MGLGFILQFVVNEILYQKFKIKAEYTRKLIHVTAGVFSVLFPLLLSNHWYLLGLTLLFIGILVITKYYGWLGSIHNIGRPSIGSFVYPVSIYFCFVVYQHYNHLVFYYLPILVMAISDPVAALAGLYWKKKSSDKQNNIQKLLLTRKTFFGTFMFFASAFVTTLFFIGNYNEMGIHAFLLLSIAVGMIGALTEFFSYRGIDNLSIPIVITILLIFFRDLFIV